MPLAILPREKWYDDDVVAYQHSPDEEGAFNAKRLGNDGWKEKKINISVVSQADIYQQYNQSGRFEVKTWKQEETHPILVNKTGGTHAKYSVEKMW